MARTAAKLDKKLSTPTLEVFDVVKSSVTSVGATAIPIPATNLSNRKGIMVQNLDTAALVYVGGSKPDIFIAPHMFVKGTNLVGNVKNLTWFPSAADADEYYAATSAGTTASLTEPVRMYGITAAGGTEALLTEGTEGTLNDHEWVWGDGDGFDTVYFRDDTGNPSTTTSQYLTLYGYPTVPEDGVGFYLGPKDSMWFTLSGSCRLWAIADTSTTDVLTLELG